jgi:ferritin-like metal-binding protein YciE
MSSPLGFYTWIQVAPRHIVPDNRGSEFQTIAFRTIARRARNDAPPQRLSPYKSTLRKPKLSRRKTMAKEPKKLDELFHDTLKDIYYAEKKILVALPKMAKAAQNEDLSAAFDKHKTETEGQVSRLEQVFELIDEKPQGKKCAAIEGILEEGQEIMKEYKGSPALDAGLLSAAQAVEHYEISRYGTLRTWAQEMGLDRAAKLLQETLDQEEATDRSLTELAEACVNQEAESQAA